MKWQVDPTNPAEILACAGIARLAYEADRTTATGFGHGPGDDTWFEAPIDEHLLGELDAGRIVVDEDTIRIGPVALGWWRRDGLNPAARNWAGNQSAVTVHRRLHAAVRGTAPSAWLEHRATVKAGLNIDPQGNWTRARIGWSVNLHPGVEMQARPWVELLASVGLETFALRPTHDPRGFRYQLWAPARLGPAAAAFAGFGTGALGHGALRTTVEPFGRNRLWTAARRIQ